MPKLTLKIHERLRALDLLKEGHTVESAVNHLHENYHANRERTEVQKAYFPKFGPFVISHLVGADSTAIDEKAKKIKENFEKQSKLGKQSLTMLHQDEEFLKNKAARARETMIANHQDPVFKKKIREVAKINLAAMRKDPNLEAKRLAALRQVLSDNKEFFSQLGRENIAKVNSNPVLTAKRLAALRRLRGISISQGEVTSGFENQSKTSTYAPDVESQVHEIRVARAVRQALLRLSAEERHLVAQEHGIYVQTSKKVLARVEQLNDETKNKILQKGLTKLAKLTYLRILADELDYE